MKTIIAMAAVAAATLASPYAAAHATLKQSDPKAGAVLAAAPGQVS